MKEQLEQRDDFIEKQMVVIRKYKEKLGDVPPPAMPSLVFENSKKEAGR